MTTPDDKKNPPDSLSVLTRFNTIAISEDWLAVILAFLLILLSAIGLLGPNGIKISF